MTVAPCHERLGNKNGVKLGRKADDFSPEITLSALALHLDVQVYHAYKPFVYFGQRMVLGETEVVHGDITSRKDNRHQAIALRIVPIIERNINEWVGNAFEKQFRVKYLHAANAHRCLCLVCRRGELAHAFNERLSLKVGYLVFRETRMLLPQGVSHAYFLANHKVIGL